MKVKVHYLFSRNEKPGSKFIQWGTKHRHNLSVTPSHIALLVNERWVFESTLATGVRVYPYSKWLEINEELDKIPCSKDREYSEIKAIYKEIQDKKYDWAGVTYFGYRLFLNRYFHNPIPLVNKWDDKDKYFCCEAVARLTGVNYDMKAPVDLMVKLGQEVS